MLDIFATVINSLLLFVFTAILAKGTGKNIASSIDGVYHLRMHKLYFYTGVISILIAAIFTLAPLFEKVDLPFFILILSIVLFFGGLGVLSLLYYKNHSLQFNASFIEVKDLWGKSKVIHWKDVGAARLNAISGLITIESKLGYTIKIHQHLVGLKTFLDVWESVQNIELKKLRSQIS